MTSAYEAWTDGSVKRDPRDGDLSESHCKAAGIIGFILLFLLMTYCAILAVEWLSELIVHGLATLVPDFTFISL